MDELFGLSMNWVIVIGLNLLLAIVLFFMSLSNRAKIRRLKAKYNRFMNGQNDVNIEAVLEDCLDKVNGVVEKNKEIDFQLNAVERNMYYCMQKVGVIRYNAFDNVGSDLSFSIAIMNNNDDGFVISSLYSRESSQTYAKPLTGGKSKYALSAEELQAIDQARKTHAGSKYKD